VDLLENPIWTALTIHQSHYAQIFGSARRFPADVCPQGAFSGEGDEGFRSLAHLAREPVTLWTAAPVELPPHWTITRAVELHVMEHRRALANVASTSDSVVELHPSDLPQMAELYQATRPGRKLCPRLHELGGFVGSKADGKVVAMACVRLHLPGYREISTVATLPGYTGQGRATAVVAALMQRIHAAGERPFLTVRTDNTRAIEIYRRLGFETCGRLHSTTIRWSAEG
jgi:ribosomal protein S18 acetylase RimI-like enzyme